MIPGQAVGSPPGLAGLSNSIAYESDNDVFLLFRRLPLHGGRRAVIGRYVGISALHE